MSGLRITCPTCADIQAVDFEYAIDHCPDCEDGLMPPRRAWAIVRAVFDDQPYDGDLPTEIAYLRGVTP